MFKNTLELIGYTETVVLTHPGPSYWHSVQFLQPSRKWYHWWIQDFQDSVGLSTPEWGDALVWKCITTQDLANWKDECIIQLHLMALGLGVMIPIELQLYEKNTNSKCVPLKLHIRSSYGFNIIFVSALTAYLQQNHDVYMPPNRHWFCSIGQTFLFFSTMCSVFFILSMTFERFYSIIQPHKSASFNTVKKAKITIAFIVVFSVLYNLPHLSISAFNGEGCIPYGRVVKHFNNLVYYWLTVTIVFVLPFFLLLTMNSIIINALRKRSTGPLKSASESVDKTDKDGGTSKMKNTEMQIFVILLLVTFAFLILTTPGYMMLLYVMLFDQTESPKAFAGYYLFYNIGQTTYYTNNAINFFLYVISGQKFRTDLRNLFRICS